MTRARPSARVIGRPPTREGIARVLQSSNGGFRIIRILVEGLSVLGRIRSYFDPFHKAEVLAQRAFVTEREATALSISLALIGCDAKLVVTLPPAPNREGLGSWTGNAVVISPRQIDGMISFLEECQEKLKSQTRPIKPG